MTFNELKKAFEEKLGIKHLSDIARELEVTPQVVSNWKARNEVPYKYIKTCREKIFKLENSNIETNSRLLGLDYFGGTSEDESTITDNVIKLSHLFIENYKLIIFIPMICIVIAFINLKFFSKPLYMTNAKILPISESSRSSEIAGLASQFGFNLGDQMKSVNISSAVMYPEIIQSTRLANILLDERFDTEKYGPGQKLINILMENSDSTIVWSDKDRRKASRRLLKMFSATKSRTLPLITLTVYTDESKFTYSLASAIIETLENLINTFKISQVKEKKLFIDNRIKEVQIKLKKKEDELKIFREKNRDIMFSPKLLIEQERLLRDVQVQTELFITLRTQYEMVRIEEVQNNSLIQLLDPPKVPDYPVKPRPKRDYFFAVILGLLLPIGFIFFREWYIENRQKILDLNN